jgi:hypothetical protein
VRRLRRQSSNALLKGKLFDDRVNPMTPSYAIKKGVRYRYYVSCVLNQGRKEEAGSVARVAADAVERIILGAIDSLPPEVRPGAGLGRSRQRREDCCSTESPLALDQSKTGSSKLLASFPN